MSERIAEPWLPVPPPEDDGPRFGECADCGCGLERPFWDTICFTCQEEREDATCSACGERGDCHCEQ